MLLGDEHYGQEKTEENKKNNLLDIYVSVTCCCGRGDVPCLG